MSQNAKSRVQYPVTPRKAFKGTEYPTAPDKGGRGRQGINYEVRGTNYEVEGEEDMSIPNFTDRTAPRAPFKPGSVPGAAWFNIETVFCHACPNPGAMLRSHGLHAEEGADPSSPGGYAEASLWAACVEAGLDREVATPETLAALDDTFRALHAEGRQAGDAGQKRHAPLHLAGDWGDYCLPRAGWRA